MADASKEITIFMPGLGGGGAEKIVIRQMAGFIDRGIKVTLLLATPEGILHDEIPQEVRVVHFHSKRTIYSVFKLARYLRRYNPPCILSHRFMANRVVLLAAMIGSFDTRINIVEHSTQSAAMAELSAFQKWLLLLSYRFLYPKAENIIHVSKGAADDLSKLLPQKNNKVTYIYNPIVDHTMLADTNEESPHPWLSSREIPVILGVGRLSLPKNFLLLLEAFVLVRRRMNARLIILGEGEERKKIEKYIEGKDLKESVLLPGFVQNPGSYMRHASLFVLSSSWEALPTVLVEAMAYGCPVVSTNCPSGPNEILENGKYGLLVPLNDPNALAEAIIRTLQNPLDKNILRNKALEFSVDNSIDNYIKVLKL